MAKIQCPHCQAVNQDVSPNDPCWKCGTVLSAPVSALDTGVGPAASTANPVDSAPAKPPTKVQQALAESEQRPAGPVYAEPPAASPSRVGLYIFLGVIVVALIILLVIYLLKAH